ncbi:hypothetical protein OUY22_01300 [Nonomuraea sp. MCN248]|uniref:Uncharacterized protein n=1 Tax=Nonomuraea corallina TaxID=2989783 RepID=A0ABT4S4F8_9ACTN|nr:hypothetical protein [Nonomuraea corallina]MDA0632035.1 hypothetical protein [Nonomuraea corallina]
MIIHAHRPYCFDLNEILALPSGFRYRSRFDSRWIDPSLRDDIEDAKGDRVLLILRDPENSQLIPVRWGIFETVQRIGRVVYFEYLLGRLVQYSVAPNVRQQEIVARTAAFADQHPWLPGPLGAPLESPSVFRSSAGTVIPTADADDLTAWGNVVAGVATAPAYKSIEFLKIVGLFDQSGSPAPVVEESLVVRPNTVYSLKVFQQIPEPPDAPVSSHSIEINTFASHVVALRSVQQSVGKYDMLTFVLRVLSLEPGERTAIEIPHVPDAATERSARTSIYLPLKVRSSSPLRLVATLATLVVSLVSMFVPQLYPLPSELVRNIAVVIFVLTLTGPSKTLATIWPSWPWGVGK